MHAGTFAHVLIAYVPPLKATPPRTFDAHDVRVSVLRQMFSVGRTFTCSPRTWRLTDAVLFELAKKEDFKVNNFSGIIFSGEFDQDQHMFYLTQVRNLDTASILSEGQLKLLIDYLTQQNESCTVLVNDQLPVLLKQEEVMQLRKELTIIINQLNNTYS